jgi:N-acetylneuraminic acid mutarotase
MIVWGGSSFNSGGRYNPATDTWTATSLTGAPEGRSQHTAVWTGTEMIIWGGVNSVRTNMGGRYNPITDSWTPTSLTGAPAGRQVHSAVWTGAEMIVWGGSAEGLSITNTGGRYNPATDSWTPTSLLGAAGRRLEHSAVWTGTEMIVWGGELNNVALNTGARYNPGTDTWKGVTMTLPPSERDDHHAAVWTGTEMIVWGGDDLDGVDTITGGRYNPATDSWTPTSETGAPIGRDNFTAVWTGSEMIVWGGAGGPLTNTGGRYCAQTGGGPVNTPPTIAGTGLTRAAGSPGASAQIAFVSDAQDAAGSLAVTINGGANATVSGVTVSGLSVNSSGQVTATVGANCTATTASFTLRVTDGGGLFDEATLDVTVNANTPPTLGTYPATSVTPGGGATVMPSVPPSDNGSIASLTASAPGFTGTFTGNPTTGVITITGANPPGNYTVTVAATDNCGVTATRTFTLAVATSRCSVTVNPATLPQPYLAVQYSVALSASPAGLHTFSVSAGALPPGLQLVKTGPTTFISGVPDVPGTYSFTIKATRNGTTCEGTRSYTVTIPPTVVPFLRCVRRVASGTYTAYFGYDNSTGAAVTIPVGADNYFTPGSQNRGQTTVFQPGRVTNAFSVTLTKGNNSNLAVWYLRGPDGVLRPVSVLTTSIGCP